MSFKHSLIALLALLIGCTEPPIIAEVARCTNCEIVLESTGVFSDSIDPGLLPDVMVFATQDASGRIYTLSRRNRAVLVFASDGTFLARLGKAGDGPGEYRFVRRILIGPADSIFVSDWSLRVHVFDPQLNFVRTQLVSNFPSLILDDGSFVVAEQISAGGKVGYPMHHMHPDGTRGKSFGTNTPQYTRDGKLMAERLVAEADSGEIWTVAPGRYVIERWNPVLGTRTRALSISSEWFKEVEDSPTDERVEPPAVIESIWENDGVIWVLFRVADENWQPPARANLERSIDPDEYQQTYDWILEAVDARDGVVLASKRFGQILWSRPPSSELVSHGISDESAAQFDVWRPVLKPHSPVEPPPRL